MPRPRTVFLSVSGHLLGCVKATCSSRVFLAAQSIGVRLWCEVTRLRAANFTVVLPAAARCRYRDRAYCTPLGPLS